MQKSDFKILNRSEIDDEKWNNCIKNSTNLIYPNSWYLDVVAPNWKGIVYKNYEAVFPLTWRKKYGISYLFQPFFTQQLGLFCIDKTMYRNLYIPIFAILKSEFKHINIHLNSHYTSNLNTNKNFELKIKDVNHHRNNFNSQTKRNLKNAMKYNLKLRYILNFKDIITLFKNTKGKEINELKNSDYNTLEQLLELVNSKKFLFTIGVYFNEELISGGIFVKFKNRITMIMLASNDKGIRKSASTLLIYEVLRNYYDYTFDFEGSNIEGLARFYSGFGAENQKYATFKHTFIPFKK